MVLEDLIRNAHTLFDERRFPSDDVAETISSSTFTYGSLFSSFEFPRSAEVIPEARRPKAEDTLANYTPAEIVSAERISVAEWRLQVPQLRLPPLPEAVT